MRNPASQMTGSGSLPDCPRKPMASRLKVVPVRKTALIAVTYASSDPAQAAQVLNTLASAYMERHLLVRRPSGEFSFFERKRIVIS
jgi:uncharacterized protein involved in exopolysaccharide biosynthesis